MHENSAPRALVTGATDGIGAALAARLASDGWFVIVGGRDASRIHAVRDRIGLERSASLLADLADLDQVAGTTRSLAANTPPRLVVHNAGVFVDGFATSPQGHELTMAVCHFAPVLMTELLAPAIGRGAHVLFVSSVAHHRGTVDATDLDFARGGFTPYAAYARAKLANVMVARTYAGLLAGRGIRVNAAHPGVVDTKLLNDGMGARGRDGIDVAVDRLVGVLTDSASDLTGTYFHSGTPAAPAAKALDHEAAESLLRATLDELAPWLAPLDVVEGSP